MHFCTPFPLCISYMTWETYFWFLLQLDIFQTFLGRQPPADSNHPADCRISGRNTLYSEVRLGPFSRLFAGKLISGKHGWRRREHILSREIGTQGVPWYTEKSINLYFFVFCFKKIHKQVGSVRSRLTTPVAVWGSVNRAAVSIGPRPIAVVF